MTKKTVPAQPDQAADGTPESATEIFKFDFSAWLGTMRAFYDWEAAAKSGEMAQQLPLLQQIVSKWPYDTPPDQLESYLDLTPAQYRAVVRKAAIAVGDFFRESAEQN